MIAESSAGNAKVKSPSRMISSSTHPLRAAAISPSEAPTSSPMPTAMTPTTIELLAPTSSSETISRPSTSVPSQCVAEGGLSLCATSISYAGHGVQIVDSSAAEITNSVSTPPVMKLRWRSARCKKPLPDRPGSDGTAASGGAVFNGIAAAG